MFQEEGQGPAVVLLHSSMSSRHQWRALAEQLRPRYRVISIDLLGYGESPLRRRDANYRLVDEARHVESILGRALPPGESFHLVGHSYGAVVAMAVAQRSPRRIDSLTLYEPVAVHLLPPRDSARLEFEQLGAEIAHLAGGRGAVAGAARFVDYWSGTHAFSALPEPRRRAFAAQLPKVQMEFRALAAERRITSWLRDFAAPVCLMHGTSSPSPARRVIAFLAALFPRMRRIEFGAGHMAPITHPQMVNPEIARFIANSAACVTDGAPVIEDHSAPFVPQLVSSLPKAFGLGLAALFCAAAATRGVAGNEHQAVEMAAPANAGRELPQDLAHGGHYAVVSGDPRVAGSFVMRIELAAGFQLPPRRAERDFQLVVLSGEMTVSRGAIAHPAGASIMKSGYFGSFGAGETYSVSTEHGVTMQVFGVGPWTG